MTTKTIGPIAFSETERALLCAVLNMAQSKTGGGPYADETSLPYFTLDFARSSLRKMRSELTDQGQQIADAVLARLKEAK